MSNSKACVVKTMENSVEREYTPSGNCKFYSFFVITTLILKIKKDNIDY